MALRSLAWRAGRGWAGATRSKRAIHSTSALGHDPVPPPEPRRHDKPVGYSEEKVTHFGYQDVTEEEKVERVLQVFDRVAASYDRMNDAMSAGVHRLWKNQLVEVLAPHRAMRLLDVAGGTGDIAFRVMARLGQVLEAQQGGPEEGEDASFGHVTCCDLNPSMLDVGKDRADKLGYSPNRISWVKGDAQSLPFEDNAFDAYTIAFGLRNVVDTQKALSEAYRVLKPGGRFLCLEFSHVENPVIEQLYDFYSFEVIPPMGLVVAGDWNSYQYLVESIRRFPKQEELKKMIRKAGFKGATYENLTFGVVAIHSGYKL